MTLIDSLLRNVPMSISYGYGITEKRYILEEIRQEENDYSRLNNLVSGPFRTKLIKICRVKNPHMYVQFMLKKEEYEARGGYAHMKELLHDTAQCNIDSILLNNLNWRKVNRFKYGKGVSFSADASYANQHSNRSNGTNRAMIVADVLIGKKCDSSLCHEYNYDLPQDDYDTSVSHNSKVYVKFYDNEFIPKYVIYYTNW